MMAVAVGVTLCMRPIVAGSRRALPIDIRNTYRYAIRDDQELPAPGRGEVLSHRVESWDSAEARRQAAITAVCARQCPAAGRYECSGMETASAGRRIQGSLGDQRQRKLASDVQVRRRGYSF